MKGNFLVQQNLLLQMARSCEKEICGSCIPPWMPDRFTTQVYGGFRKQTILQLRELLLRSTNVAAQDNLVYLKDVC